MIRLGDSVAVIRDRKSYSLYVELDYRICTDTDNLEKQLLSSNAAKHAKNMGNESFSCLTFAAPFYPTSIRSFRQAVVIVRAPVTRKRIVTRAVPNAALQKFNASDFEIRRIVGEQGYAMITDWEYYDEVRARDPLAPTRTTEKSPAAVRLYEAVILSPPELRNARVLLKEFLNAGVELAVNEAEAYNLLYAASPDERTENVPVARCLGSFLTDESFAAPGFREFWANRFPRSPIPPAAGAPFLVFPFNEFSYTAENAAAISLSDDVPGVRFLNKLFPSLERQSRAIYARALCSRAVGALRYLHNNAGIVHRSLGLASLTVSSIEYKYADSLVVKIRDLGFAKPMSSLISVELDKARKAGAVTPSEIARYFFAEDIYALGYALVEYIFAAFSESKAMRTQDFFKKIFEDTFELNTDQFRSYCCEDPDYASAVEFLDEGDRDGWTFLQTMLQARQKFKETTLEEIAALPFLVS